MSYKVKTYKDLIVWQKSMQLVTKLYKITASFPREELFGLTSQIRRSVVSIPSNIAEGYGRKSTNEYIRFLQISVGSLFELQTQIEISFNLSFIDENIYNNFLEMTKEVERMLCSMISKIRKYK